MFTYDSLLSVITQMIIEMPTLWLVENYPISRRNNSTQGNYDNEETVVLRRWEALMYKMVFVWVLDVFKEEGSKSKESALSLIITRAVTIKNYLLRLNEQSLRLWISKLIPKTLLHNIDNKSLRKWYSIFHIYPLSKYILFLKICIYHFPRYWKFI